jgi:hypothetical protein
MERPHGRNVGVSRSGPGEPNPESQANGKLTSLGDFRQNKNLFAFPTPLSLCIAVYHRIYPFERSRGDESHKVTRIDRPRSSIKKLGGLGKAIENASPKATSKIVSPRDRTLSEP